eukprot:TRINITY_DN94841_c0_g1_i1.p1 TRINITY_DN94841_c0_g1~~TRINITY_DN94841_c0_g1_i1.p1  ORF type:complete len:509 (-),score=68.70 TRINITY_DN94841_c0_g1_i1:43-1509(-)
MTANLGLREHSLCLPRATGSEDASSCTVARSCARRGRGLSWLPAQLFLSILLAAALPAEGKVQVSTVSLGGMEAGERKRWAYLSKFGYATGQGQYRVRFRFHRLPTGVRASGTAANVSLRFEAYLDEHWPQVEPIADQCKRGDKAKKFKAAVLTPDEKWGDWITGSVKQSVRSHIWYYALSDCQSGDKMELSSLSPTNRGIEVDFEIEFLQENGSHFGVEQRWTLPSNVLSLLGFAAFVVIFAMRCRSEAESAGKLHAVLWTLAAVVALQLAAQALHALHLMRYSSNGTGIRAMEICAEMFFILAQLVQSALLILIGLGYTLTPVKIQPELVCLVAITLSLVHIVLVFVTKSEDGAADKFHDYETVAGKIVLVIRLLLYAGFLWAVHRTRTGVGFRLRNFLGSFRLAGTVFFLGPPLLVLGVTPFAPYLRPPILTTAFLLLQIGTNLWLHNLFLSRGEYFNVSNLSDSPLPGGTPRSRSPGGDSNKHD